MAAIYARPGTRCLEHPHRLADQRCDGCGQPFCVECLSPTERAADGERDWFCAKCVWLERERRERETRERSLEYRLAAAGRRARIATITAVTVGVLLVAATSAYFVVARRFGTAVPAQALAERAA